MSQMSIGLDKKLIFLVLIASVVAIIASAVLSFSFAEAIISERIGNQLVSESQIRGEAVEKLYETRIKQIQIISTNPMIQTLTSSLNDIPLDDENINKINERRRDFLIEVQAFQELVGFSIGFEDLKVIGKNGNALFSLGKTDMTKDYSSVPLFVDAMSNPVIMIDVTLDGYKKMIIALPIFDKDDKSERIGVLITSMRTSDYDRILLQRSGLGETGEVYTVNKDQLMISDSRFIEDSVLKQIVDTPPVRLCFENGSDMSGEYDDYRGIPIVGSSHCSADFGFVLIAEIDKEETIQPIMSFQGKLIIAGGMIAIGMGFIAFFMSKLISKPIIKLKNAANLVASGDFTVRTNIRSGDEIGKLSESFDTMAKKIEESEVVIRQKDELIKEQKDVLLQFTEFSEKFCVCMVDVVQSTKITANLSDLDTSKFYSNFLNNMAQIVRDHNGIVVKNIGDALLFYFPKTNSEDMAELKNSMNCCFEMINSRNKINELMLKDNLPQLSYKISATYGPVRIASIATSAIDDIFGSTVNRCAKINRFAPQNGIVVGDALHRLIQTQINYSFEKIDTDNSDEFTVYILRQNEVET